MKKNKKLQERLQYGILFMITLLYSILLTGCGKPEEELPDTSKTETTSGNPIDPDSWGGDNSLDAYSAALHKPLLAEEPENATGGGRQLFLGADRAYFFTKHLLGTARESWDELSFVTVDGEKGSRRFDFGNWLYGIGPVAGTDHYVAFLYEASEDGENNRYFLMERDENHQAVKEISLDFLTSSADSLVLPSYLAVDASGIIHLVYQADSGQQYLLVSPEGELLLSTSSDVMGMTNLYDGRIAFWRSIWEGEGRSMRTELQCMDSETGKQVLLASMEENVEYVTLFDENTLLYADREGVYRSSLTGENPEMLYRWTNHGIAAVGIAALQADGEGDIAVIYEGAENYNYLYLKPTTEEVEICQITLANLTYRDYHMAVTEFNKRNPRWHIEIKSDYDKAALLTQLGAGNGPVLIDTLWVDFKELEKLWEPLDTVIEQLGITEELVPSVLELGKINGIQYGIVADFGLSTLVTGNKDLKDWDYDTFLQCFADSPELETFFDIYEGGNYGSLFIVYYLCNGMDDACFWDAEAGTTNFDSNEFRQVLKLAEKYCTPKEAVPVDISMLEAGKVLVNRVSIGSPQDIAAIRIYYGEDANYIGFPTGNGSVHRIENGAPLVIRKTATEEEKEVAIAFIDFLLSYEGQQLAAKDRNFNMSVRRDVLEEQIAAMNKGTRVELGDVNRIKFSLGDQLNIELDRNTLLQWIDTAEPAKNLPGELKGILYEELDQYFSGAITEDLLIDRLESRVGLYLNERN